MFSQYPPWLWRTHYLVPHHKNPLFEWGAVMDSTALSVSVLSSANVFPKTTHHTLSEIYFICILILNRAFIIITIYEPPGKDRGWAVSLLYPFIPLRKKTKAGRNWLPCLYLEVFSVAKLGLGPRPSDSWHSALSITCDGRSLCTAWPHCCALADPGERHRGSYIKTIR